MSACQFVKYPAFLWALRAIAVAAACLAAWHVAMGAWPFALTWIAIAALAAACAVFSEKLPPFFGSMVTLAAVVNGAGYTVGLWQQETSFDEAVHAFTHGSRVPAN